jgi:hypothetical protein
MTKRTATVGLVLLLAAMTASAETYIWSASADKAWNATDNSGSTWWESTSSPGTFAATMPGEGHTCIISNGSARCRTVNGTTNESYLIVADGGRLEAASASTATASDLHLRGGEIQKGYNSAVINGGVSVELDSTIGRSTSNNGGGDDLTLRELTGTGNLLVDMLSNNLNLTTPSPNYSGTITITNSSAGIWDGALGSGTTHLYGVTQFRTGTYTNTINVYPAGGIRLATDAIVTVTNLHLKGGELACAYHDGYIYGTIYVDEDSYLHPDRGNQTDDLFIYASLIGSNNLTFVGEEYAYIRTANPSFSGNWIIEGDPDSPYGNLLINTLSGAFGSGYVDVRSGQFVSFSKSNNDGEFIVDNDLYGEGTYRVNGYQSTDTIVIQRSEDDSRGSINPGPTNGGVGILTLQDDLAFRTNSAGQSPLVNIDISGINAVAGTDYDQIDIIGLKNHNESSYTVDLTNAVLAVNVTVDLLDLLGDTFTVIQLGIGNLTTANLVNRFANEQTDNGDGTWNIILSEELAGVIDYAGGDGNDVVLSNLSPIFRGTLAIIR